MIHGCLLLSVTSMFCFVCTGLTDISSAHRSPVAFNPGFVHPLQDVALHECLPLSSVCCLSVPGGSLLPCYVVLSSSASARCRPLDLFPLLGCLSVQRLVLHSCYIMSGPFPLLFQCVFYNVSYLVLFPIMASYLVVLDLTFSIPLHSILQHTANP